MSTETEQNAADLGWESEVKQIAFEALSGRSDTACETDWRGKAVPWVWCRVAERFESILGLDTRHLDGEVDYIIP